MKGTLWKITAIALMLAMAIPGSFGGAGGRGTRALSYSIAGELHTDHFNVAYQTGAIHIAEKVALLAEEVLVNASEFLQFEPSYKITITLYDSVEPFYDSRPYWGGDYFGNMGTAFWKDDIRLYLPPIWCTESLLSTRRSVVMRVLAHEFNHALLAGAMPSTWAILPAWYVEGMAQYYESIVFEGQDYSAFQTVLYRAVMDGKIEGLDDINYVPTNEEDVILPYFAGCSIFIYVSQLEGADGIEGFVQAFKGWSAGDTMSGNLDNVIQAAVGMGRIEFEESWLEWLNTRFIVPPGEPEHVDGIRYTNSSVMKVPTSWGDDGILYSDGSNGSLDIYLLRPEDGDVKRLTITQGTDTDARFSPDGTKIAFTSMRSGTFDIYLMDSDGSDVEQLTDDGSLNVGPAWSSDGKRLAFVSDRYGTNDIFEYNIENKTTKCLISTASDEGGPAYSPDGSKLAYCSNSSGYYEIFALDFQTNDTESLLGPGYNAVFPSWSPDGTMIACITPSDGIAVKNLTNGNVSYFGRKSKWFGPDYAAPVWAPNSTAVCAAIEEWKTPTSMTANIYGFVVKEGQSDGGELQQGDGGVILLAIASFSIIGVGIAVSAAAYWHRKRKS